MNNNNIIFLITCMMIIHISNQYHHTMIFATKDCIKTDNPNNDIHKYQQQQHFTLHGEDVFFKHKQAKVRTSPNCLFPQYDAKLKQWDHGGFCLEETMTGGACVGKIIDPNSNLYDIYFPRMDGPDKIYHYNTTHFIDISIKSNITNENVKWW